METSKADIKKTLKNYRLQFEKSKKTYSHYVNPKSEFLISDAKTKTFRAKILEQEAKNTRALIMICNEFLQSDFSIMNNEVEKK